MANLLTALRLLLAPLIIREILTGRHSLALALFALAALTDAADGALARRFGSVTPAGAYLDPIADKVLLSGIYVALTVIGSVPLWLTLVIFGRDLLLLVSAGAVLLLTSHRQLPPSLWGKLSTLAQIVTATAFMTNNALDSATPGAVCAVLSWTALAATAWSGLHYLWRGWRMLRHDQGTRRAASS